MQVNNSGIQTSGSETDPERPELHAGSLQVLSLGLTLASSKLGGLGQFLIPSGLSAGIGC
jgi:hypothetical protein